LNANAIIDATVILLIISGTLLSLISAFGILRLPDVYTRAHATTKSATLGVLFVLLGAFLYFLNYHAFVSIRLLLGIAFVFLTAPVAGHLIIRSAHRSGVKLAEISVQDQLKEDLDKMGEQPDEMRQETGQRLNQSGETS